MNSVAMIPLRMGSKRVPKKNIRILRGLPLCFYIIKSVIDSQRFDKNNIYINSEDTCFESVARHFGIQFYKRDPNLSKDSSTNDDFLFDFISNISCDYIYQFLATSPLVEGKTISDFYDKSKQYDTFISVSKHQIESVYNEKEINFNFLEQTPPSQNLKPVYTYACGLMSWEVKTYLSNYKELDKAGYHGGKGTRGFYELSTIESIDVDNPEDFTLAELALENREKSKYITPPEVKYWDGKFTFNEVHVPNILVKDGVQKSTFDKENKLVININNLIQEGSTDQSWIYRAINTNSNSACLISQLPGEGNRWHCHYDWDEFWLILKGTWNFKINKDEHIVKQGDLILIPRGVWHKITAIGSESAIRLAVSRQDVVHSYEV